MSILSLKKKETKQELGLCDSPSTVVALGPNPNPENHSLMTVPALSQFSLLLRKPSIALKLLSIFI